MCFTCEGRVKAWLLGTVLLRRKSRQSCGTTSDCGFIIRIALRIDGVFGEIDSRVSMLVGSRRNRRLSNASGFSLTNFNKSSLMWSEYAINPELTRPARALHQLPEAMTDQNGGDLAKAFEITNGRNQRWHAARA